MATKIISTDDAFRTFAMEAPHQVRTLRKRLMERHSELAQAITGGYVTDYPDYKGRVGQLQGIQIALDICNEMEKQENQ